MKGFFSINNSVKKSGCGISCLLNKSCKTQFKSLNNCAGDFLLITDFPSKMEDKKGKKLSDIYSETILENLSKYNLQLDKNCSLTYAVKCCPSDSNSISKKEIDTCSNILREEIISCKPKVILLLGEIALESFLKNRWKKDLGTIHKWRGLKIYDREYNCWVVATYSPAWIQEQKQNEIILKIFKNDFKLAISLLEIPIPSFEDEKQFIQIITNENQACKMLERIRQKEKLIAIDFETTGLRPYSKGHNIISFSIAYSEFSCFSCLASSKTKEILKTVLTDPSIKKIASNMKYEHLWAREILGVEIKGWIWDTMLASHILDNRTGINGLKFQVYTNFGIIDYSSKIEKYLDSKKGIFNNIKEAPVEDLLLYNGLDSLFEFRLAKIQMKELYI